MDPKGKVILVTGASSGIGLASARALAAAGAMVALAARSAQRLEHEAATSGGLAVPMDVTDDTSVADGVARVLDRFGHIDAVVNFAGNGGRLTLWDEAPADHLRTMVDTHLFGAERVARAVLPSMLARGQGIIVNIASTVGWVPMPAAAAYSAAKAAILAFSESLRGELAGRGVRVMVFAPPHTSTEAGKEWPLEGPRVHTPEWVAEQFVRALRAEQPRFLAGASNRMLLGIQRLSPAYAAFIMRRIGLKALRAA